MKKVTLYLFFALALSVTLTSCKKSESEPVVDPRDAWVGNYTETYTGTITINIPGQPMTVPVNDTGSFSIEKGTAENRIVRVDQDTIKTGGTISGSTVVFDPVPGPVVQEGVTTTSTMTATGTLNGKVINYTATITGSVSMSDFTFTLTGNLTGVATKK